MTDPAAFAAEWQAAWNAHDLDRILSHYSDDVVFRSRKAVDLVGRAEVRGKAALGQYWGRALDRQPNLTFTVTDVYGGHDMMVIAYRNHRDVRAAETLYFGSDDLVWQAAACHAGPSVPRLT